MSVRLRCLATDMMATAGAGSVSLRGTGVSRDTWRLSVAAASGSGRSRLRRARSQAGLRGDAGTAPGKTRRRGIGMSSRRSRPGVSCCVRIPH